MPLGTLAGYNGDPSLAVGQSGDFYYALIGFPSNAQNSTAIWRSTDNGQNFAFRANAVVCPNLSTPPNAGRACFADQEHIAADRWNAAAGGDQVYSTWRNFDAADQDPALVCSQDSGRQLDGADQRGHGRQAAHGRGTGRVRLRRLAAAATT